MDDQLLNAIPPKYLGLAVAVLGLLRALDGIIRLIPDRWLSAHTTTEAIVLALRKAGGWLFTRKAAPPALLLLAVLVCGGCGAAVGSAIAGIAVVCALVLSVWYAVTVLLRAPRPRDRYGNPLGLALLLLLAVPACGHAAQAARGTFATLAAAEHSYARWATAEVDRLVAQARTDCPAAPDRAACAERLTASTFRALEITDAALISYHEAQRAAAVCLAKGGDVAACTGASAKAAGVLLEQLGAVGFEVRP